MIALTFDDGPGPTTNKILDILYKHKVCSTFFVTGNNLLNSPWSSNKNEGWIIGKRILSDGHLMGNHTFSHQKIYNNEQEFIGEISMVDSLIVKLYKEVGRTTKTIPVRLPFGLAVNDKRLNYLVGIGKSHTHWTNAFNDWHEGAIDSLFDKMIKYVEERELLNLNSVLDLHDGGIGNQNGYKREATAHSVEKLIEESLKRGWRFFQIPIQNRNSETITSITLDI